MRGVKTGVFLPVLVGVMLILTLILTLTLAFDFDFDFDSLLPLPCKSPNSQESEKQKQTNLITDLLAKNAILPIHPQHLPSTPQPPPSHYPATAK